MNESTWVKQVRLLSFVLATLLSHMGLGFFLGYLLKSKSEWFMICGVILGLVTGIFQIQKYAKKTE